MGLRLRNFLPRGLYGRAALILIVPIVTIQAVVSIVFVQRHFENVARAMAEGVAAEIQLVGDTLQTQGAAAASSVARALAMDMGPVGAGAAGIATMDPGGDLIGWEDFSGRAAAEVLHMRLPGLRVVDFATMRGWVLVHLDTTAGPLVLEVERARLSARNPHQLLVLMVFTGLVMTVVAFVFLRNQLRPIAQLADAAEAFGKGQVVRYRPRGATEVRAAGAAFHDMRARIERQIEQRTMMLSGISHDLRTPLTRLRLSVAMLDPGPDAVGMEADLNAMERMVDAFLAFVRDAATEDARLASPADLVADAAAGAARSGAAVAVRPLPAGVPRMALRVDALGRALDNLVNNAARHGRHVEIGLELPPGRVIFAVEDDGPGIAPDRREEAMRPFTRLDPARDPNHAGVGLGLAIAADVARSHGGALRLEDSARLGGLRVVLDLPA